MGLINRNTGNSVIYGGSSYSGPIGSETGDTEIEIREQVGAGATLVVPASFAVADETCMMAHSDNLDTVVTDGTDTFLAAGIGVREWTLASGETNPLTGPTVANITIDNTGGSEVANVTIFILVENP